MSSARCYRCGGPLGSGAWLLTGEGLGEVIGLESDESAVCCEECTGEAYSRRCRLTGAESGLEGGSA